VRAALVDLIGETALSFLIGNHRQGHRRRTRSRISEAAARVSCRQDVLGSVGSIRQRLQERLEIGNRQR